MRGWAAASAAAEGARTKSPTSAGAYMVLYGAGTTKGGCGRMNETWANHGRSVLLAEPADELAGEVGGLGLVFGVGGRRVGDFAGSGADGQVGVIEIEALLAQPGEPGAFVLGELHACGEAGEDALVGGVVGIVGRLAGGVERDVGVTEQRRVVAGAAGGAGDVVEAVGERRTVAADAVVHLVEAGIEAGAGRRAGGGLGVVIEERRALSGQRIERSAS